MPVQGLLWVASLAWLRGDLVGLVLAGLIAVWALCRLTKRKVGRTRPHEALPDARLVGRVPGGSSFPSSHAALTVYSATMATLLGFSAAPGLWLVAGAVAYARVYLGVHYPRDILGGAALGAAGAVAALLLLGRFIFS
jgi:undecaprenyl-diphosphatase